MRIEVQEGLTRKVHIGRDRGCVSSGDETVHLHVIVRDRLEVREKMADVSQGRLGRRFDGIVSDYCARAGR